MEILRLDKNAVVCVKPAGVSSESPGMPELIKEECGLKDLPFAVHRLDTGVGGVMVYALSREAAAFFSRQIAERALKKEYFAVVSGVLPQRSGEMEDLLFKDSTGNKSFVVSRMRAGVKKARLSYRVIDEKDGASLVKVSLDTGRSHQIRVQFSSRGLPLFGDRKYGSRISGCGIALWSCGLSLMLPSEKETAVFKALPPRIFPWDIFSFEKYEKE